MRPQREKKRIATKERKEHKDYTKMNQSICIPFFVTTAENLVYLRGFLHPLFIVLVLVLDLVLEN